MDCNIESSKLNSRATQKPLTENPSKNLSAKRMMQALMTSKNNPRVTTVIGKVRMTKMGFKRAFNNPKTMATIMAPVNPATLTPGRTLAKMMTATAVSKRRMIRFIFIVFSFYFFLLSGMLKTIGREYGTITGFPL